ncbi:ABC transporter domain-containing protein [Caenorhabditis elegans]|uniref:ABC transporter domain-containing protein n=1 Tax=Caenorhabditis elegans TaxID=6239 RepID=Q22802_CAEEL|nr:ABC transporter domain-containing protein [Caenorhabditis elegans]CCD63207.1 ABC transporter domain-containing protein [Caenorhabditis elegans]|eukprot:NP_498425.2 WHiTe (Drosophila) related ABC transporter [Caenorhabditis elegans]
MSEEISYEKILEDVECTAVSPGYSTLGDIVPVSLHWNNITVTTIKEKRLLLKNVSGYAKSGELLALMGASGAGKTTLLNMLMCRNLKGLSTEGTITVNGNEMAHKISSISGFAQQEELFVGTLTVKEYLMIQAKLRINGSKKLREDRVTDVLHQLKLWKCRDSKIGVIGEKKGISGGEARRLTFACEMLSNPSLLFADEPTTGLDSFMAESVIQILKGIAKTGRTIICTIHQPSSQLYQMFHRVIYLANGSTAFQGTPQESISFFEKCGHRVPDEYNPSEWIIYKLAVQPGQEKQSNDRIQKIVEQYEDSDHQKRVMEQLSDVSEKIPPPEMHRANVFTQIFALSTRCGIDVWRAPQLTLAKVIQKILFGLFIGLLYLRTPYDARGIHNINGALFFLAGEYIYSTAYAIMFFLNNEFPLVAREYHDGLYNLWTYYFARCISLIPLFSTDGLILLFIVYWLIGLNTSVMQVIVASIITVLASQAASAFGIAMSCIFPTAQMTAVMASPPLVLFRLFGGLYGNTNTFPAAIRWLQWISMYRFAFEGLVVNQWSEIDDFHSNAKNNWTNSTTNDVLDYFAFSESAIPLDIIGLILISLAFYLIGFIALVHRMKKAR